MDPTAAVPLHFTLEIVTVVAAGLILAWATFNKRWIAACGALAFGTAQALHAGSFVASDDDAVVIVLRLVGIAAIIAGSYNVKVRRELLFSGLALVLGGALWGAFAGGSASDLTIGPHIFNAVGGVVLLVWTWLVTRPSVRLRVLASFVLVLGVAVIVTGGSVARVAAVEKRDEEISKLGPTAVSVRQEISSIATDAATRAAAFSPQLAPRLGGKNPTVVGVVLRSGELAVMLDRAGHVRATEQRGDVSFDARSIASTDAFRAAAEARVATSYSIATTGLAAIGASPVFRPGGTQSPADVIGVVAIVRPLAISAVQAMVKALEPSADVAVTDRSGHLVSTNAAARTLKALVEGRPSVVTPLDQTSGISLAIAVPRETVVDATRTLVRSFLIALLASALLAVVVALWLAARITRPMLDLVDEGERLKTDFLASVSHELRTPLTPIRGYTEILRRGRVPARRATGYLDEIGQAAQRLERIVSLLVDVASIEAGRFHVSIEDVSANEIIDAVATRWRTESSDHPIRLTAKPDLPAVHADPVAIGRVLDELVDNAVKFSPEGSTISLEAETSGGGVTFSVRDEGQGIEPNRLAELGAAFEQLDSGDTRRFGGLGLGLNYARGVLRTHNSRLELTSEPKAGTTSSFTLRSAGIVTRMPAKATRTRKASKPKVR